ncbi:MAG: type I restriction enzyme HsdR N-terminal domain-containing protein [Nitrospirota bacterium]|jgi:hypothetical protein
MSSERQREELAAEKARTMDEIERLQTETVRGEMLRFLTEHRGYAPGDIERDKEFRVGVAGCEETVSTDFIIKLQDKRFMAIKCAAGAVDSRERHIISLARVVDEYQIPYCLVTDGENTRVIDTMRGEIISEDLYSVPRKEEAVELLQKTKLSPYSPEKLEREKRILLAFEAVRCPNAKP